ncbi:mediator of RNA polymerase II transcription subunit 1-like [Gossypium australe]|uniref:Mediator of RNA polymerase II transcription subunit 1-like n=1 Tax=Gossypium australe TaxID=47621 RepID=A0A5B6V8C1_9ROSI|nr:mediator of RNA polymerase II transcription subunit 1-like [Gossypium australe]
MIYGKQGEPLHQRTVVNSRDSGINNHYDGNGLLYGGTFGSSINKAVFEKDFPSLGTEERQGVSEIARVSSPSFSSVSQSLPIHNSTLIDGEGWTSALAEVPSVNGSSGTGSLPASLIDSTSGSGSPSVTAGLNMAEALTQAPPRTHTIPRLSVKTQRCEELAIKQSRQLIPVTPSMPKGSVSLLP